MGIAELLGLSRGSEFFAVYGEQDEYGYTYLTYKQRYGDLTLENAVLKAEAYHAVSGLPSFSLDSGLYLEGVPAELQPGPYVRRVKGRELSDEEFIAYYQQLAHQYGGRLKARFINGLCVVLNDRQRKEAAGPQVSTDWFWIVETPHPTRLKGFPMDSIAVDPQTGRYWVEGDLKDEQNAKGSTLATGVRRFFSELLQNDLRSEIVPYPDRSEKNEK